MKQDTLEWYTFSDIGTEMILVQEKFKEWLEWVYIQQVELDCNIGEYQLGMEFQIIVKEYSDIVQKLNLIETHVHRLQRDIR